MLFDHEVPTSHTPNCLPTNQVQLISRAPECTADRIHNENFLNTANCWKIWKSWQKQVRINMRAYVAEVA